MISSPARIVDLNAGYPMLKHELSPSRENLRRLRKESQERLKAIHVSRCLFGSETETICVGRPRGGVPELDEVLRKAEELLPLTIKRLHGASRG